MTVAVISLATPQTVIATYGSVPSSFPSPNGDEVHGAQPGWVSQDGNYSLVNVAPFVVPQGQQISGPATYSVANGVVTQSYPTQAIPAPQTAANLYNTAINAGIVLTWSISTALNGAYALDINTQVGLIGEFISTQNFSKPPINWYKMDGTAVAMTTAQANLFGAAIWGYLTAARAAQAIAAAGGTPTWPSNAINITG